MKAIEYRYKIKTKKKKKQNVREIPLALKDSASFINFIG